MSEQPQLNKVFVSYNWSAEDEQVRRAEQSVVDALQQAAKTREIGIEIIRDIDAIDYRDSIRDFMHQLSRGRCIVVVLSDAYLRSSNCMRELLGIHDHGDFLQRVFPIVHDGTDIYSDTYPTVLREYWSEKASKRG